MEAQISHDKEIQTIMCVHTKFCSLGTLDPRYPISTNPSPSMRNDGKATINDYDIGNMDRIAAIVHVHRMLHFNLL